MRCVRAHSGEVPAPFRKFTDLAAYKKAVAYTIDKTKFSIVEDACMAVFLAVVLGAMDTALDVRFSEWTCSACQYGGQALTLIFMAIVLSLPEVPFEAGTHSL